MATLRRALAFALFIGAIYAFAKTVAGFSPLFNSAYSFRLHHEAATALCRFLVWPILALACLVAGSRALGRADRLPLNTDGAEIALVALIPILIGCALIFENEIFFALYDPKGFPVHPPEMIAHPRGRWVRPSDHAFVSVALAVLGAFNWWALRGETTSVPDDSPRGRD
ncbi:hypothetical protein KDL45_00185 [bacterium]|nr:hypothetical protein [bacterium]MCB9477290.1 hypothetical protein [Deltaproteobacteria bacterium]